MDIYVNTLCFAYTMFSFFLRQGTTVTIRIGQGTDKISRRENRTRTG